MTTNKGGFLQALWDFFCSLKLSIFLLIGLAATSIIGTVIPQGTPPPEYLHSISQTKLQVYEKLGFFDMYHSWWFILLLYLLTVNLVACSIKRLPRVWKMISEPTLVMDEGVEKSLSLTHEMKLSGDLASQRQKLTEFLKAEFAAPVVTEHNGEYHLFAQKSPYSRLGVYVVHLSIIIIFIGALIGSFFGYKAFVNIVEGTSTSTVYTRTEKPIELGFAVKCEKFSVSFYDTGAPKEFKSVLTVLENGQPVQGYQNIPIVVNHPLTYKGITFYQSSYGPAGDSAVFHLTVQSRKGGAPVKLIARQGESVALPGGGTVQVVESTQEVRSFIPEFSGPAVKIEVRPAGGGAPQSFIVFRNYPDFDAQRGDDLIFNYTGSDEKFYTGLQVAKDPGVWVVWLGCILMVIGIMMAFFMSHKRIWIRIAQGRVVVGGTASKNPAAFQGTFENLVDKLKKG
ncbi:cytochrome c biogenesis protein ResB [Geobacter sp. DSM 9736]|uniref:cytochrome c biogenesis protein ResB n=1 Tax=Geobacter sp. DSM 9736 TaxID=1277350 RepID=UPI000B506A90|nr:cytochrome c biogenesis protein ResB [Geobacter sp. DSM 9736]SNB46646.1 cytochrome c biogenesis protein [Geobacter sp. DSM 9736]